jgi:tetraacyldisaccharide 4'-kinase
MIKTPSFWFAKPGRVAAALTPLSLLWQVGGSIRRLTASPQHLDVPLIIVGNLVAGGGGKTPVVMALAKHLKKQGKRVHLIAKGYGGTTTSPTRVTNAHTAEQVGDEPLLLKNIAPTFIGRNRRATAEFAAVGTDIIISDDGLQNPHLIPTLALLVMDARGIGNGKIMPAGPLREPLQAAARRAHALIQTSGTSNLKTSLPVLRTSLTMTNPDELAGQQVVAFAGMANPEKFFSTCREAGANLARCISFSDHHFYSDAELTRLKAYGHKLVTTEKDYVRLPLHWQRAITPIKVELHFNDKAQLDALLKKYLP